MLTLILLVFAFVLLVIAGFLAGPPAPSENPWRSRLVCFGLACWVLAEILNTVPKLPH
jgi:hypothetical protein